MKKEKEPCFWEKAGWFIDALKEFLARPKTRFDIRDRSIWLLFFIILVIVVEFILHKAVLP